MTSETAVQKVGGIGYCKVCASSLRDKINKRLSMGVKLAAIIRWAATEGFSVSDVTLAKHRDHATDPKTTLVEAARRNPAIRRSTPDEFLDTVINIANAKAEGAPEMVTLDHGLRASQVKLTRKQDDPTEAMLLFVREAFSIQRHPEAQSEPETIEGEFKQLSTAEEEDGF